MISCRDLMQLDDLAWPVYDPSRPTLSALSATRDRKAGDMLYVREVQAPC